MQQRNNYLCRLYISFFLPGQWFDSVCCTVAFRAYRLTLSFVWHPIYGCIWMCLWCVCVQCAHERATHTEDRIRERETEIEKGEQHSFCIFLFFNFIAFLLFWNMNIWIRSRVCVSIRIVLYYFPIAFHMSNDARLWFSFSYSFWIFFFWFICIIYCRGFWFLHVWNVNENEQKKYRLEILFVCFLFYFCRTKITNHPRNVRPRTPCCCGASARRMAINMSPYTWVHA